MQKFTLTLARADEGSPDVTRKRRMEDVPALAEAGHVSGAVIFHLGSNRPFEASVFDQVMESLLEHQVGRIIFINVHRPIGWEYYVNKQFAEGVARWPQAELIGMQFHTPSKSGSSKTRLI